MAKTTRRVDTPAPKALDYDETAFIDVNDIATLQKLIDSTEQALQTKDARVAIDTETTGLIPVKNKPFGFSICFGEVTYWCNTDSNDVAIRHEALTCLRQLMEAPHVMKVFHHMKFDFGMIYNHYGIGMTPYYNDTLLMSRVIMQRPKHSLKSYISQYWSELAPYDVVVTEYRAWYKRKNHEECLYNEIPDRILVPYACADAYTTYHLYDILRERYVKEGLDSSLANIYDLERRCQFVIAYMERVGIVVDPLQLNAVREEFTMTKQSLVEDILPLIPHIKTEEELVKMMNSPKQKVLFFVTQLGLKAVMQTKTGAPSVDGTFFDHYKDKNEIVRLVSEFLQYQFVLNKLEEMSKCATENPDGTLSVHTSYNQILETGRLSSTGVNLQNIPKRTLGAKEIRHCVVAPKGHSLIEIDYQAMELRLIATASQDKTMVGYMQEGKDVHSLTAASFFKRDISFYKKPRSDEATHERDLSKNLGFGLCYGLGPNKLASMYKLPRAQASQFKEFYFNKYYGIAAYRERTNHQTAQNGYVFTMCGRRRFLDPTQVYTCAVNTVIQGTGADVLKYGLVDVFEYLTGYDLSYRADNVIKLDHMNPIDIRLTVHDSILLTIPDSNLNELKYICTLMERPRYERIPQIPLLVETSVGPDWASLKEITV